MRAKGQAARTERARVLQQSITGNQRRSRSSDGTPAHVHVGAGFRLLPWSDQGGRRRSELVPGDPGADQLDPERPISSHPPSVHVFSDTVPRFCLLLVSLSSAASLFSFRLISRPLSLFHSLSLSFISRHLPSSISIFLTLFSNSSLSLPPSLSSLPETWQ